MKKVISICLALAAVVSFSACIGDRVQKETERVVEMLSQEVDSMHWALNTACAGGGSTTMICVDSVKSYAAVRLWYAFDPNGGRNGMTIYLQEGDSLVRNPIVVAPGKESNYVYLTNVTPETQLKIISEGIWAIACDSLANDSMYVSKIQSEILDQQTIKSLKDSIEISKINRIDTVAPNYPFLETMVASMIEDSKTWRTIDHRKGYGEFETDWFYLPACQVKVDIVAAPSDGLSFHGSASLEGKARNATWTVLDGATYYSRSETTCSRSFNVPAGNYFFGVYADDAYWEYIIYARY